MEDKKISEAVELLFKGAKMLAYHCPECKMPLFKYKDKILCPSCKKEAVIVKEGEVETVVIREDRKEEVKDTKEKEEIKVKEVRNVYGEDVESILKDGLTRVAKYLRDCKDIDEMQKVVVILDKLINIIEKIKKIK